MSAATLTPPDKGGGLIDVLRHRELLRLIVRKELKVRYRSSVLGLLWSYVKPAVQFVVFYFALGVFLGLNKQPNFVIYMFSGIILVNFFSEAFGQATRSIVANGALVKKIFLPRELFPVASVWVAIVHFLPQLLILLTACLFFGWSPSVIQLIGAVGAFVIVTMLGLGLGLFFSAANVMFRDSENIVDLMLMMATWLSPVLYAWYLVRDTLGETFYFFYQLNPMTIAVELFHAAFWFPTDAVQKARESAPLPEHLISLWLPVGLLIAAFFLFLGQTVFRRLEGRFAQEL
ncbi:ABC-2 type transport system permease protein [Arthrobacter sp. SLBN-100]|uniref:ABC transporter permease n=1 Tax=Arthrobacter sp. SLBN-100 TaxID=2768450 RepID=UPI0011528FB6|nr:ABC transporter permease [Arthrobacter sp. SLBN-100]TQJ67193.1 ABC-2 type transport system permease protein [Arthrobacter sp. SLBN-100]